MTNALSTVDLLEQCLPVIEDKYLRFSDPWTFFIMCTAIMLIKIHLGKESRQNAKSSCARRFLDLYYKNVWMHQPADLAQQQAISQDIVNQTAVSFVSAAFLLIPPFCTSFLIMNINLRPRPSQASHAGPPPPPDASALPTAVWLDSSYPDVSSKSR